MELASSTVQRLLIVPAVNNQDMNLTPIEEFNLRTQLMEQIFTSENPLDALIALDSITRNANTTTNTNLSTHTNLNTSLFKNQLSLSPFLPAESVPNNSPYNSPFNEIES